MAVKSKGHFEDGGCTKEDFTENRAHVKKYKGRFEWLPGAQVDCVLQKDGKYKNDQCSEEDVSNGKGRGRYERTGGASFEGAGGEALLAGRLPACETESEEVPPLPHPRADCTLGYGPPEVQIEVRCTGESSSGELAGSDEVTGVAVRFSGCEDAGVPATSEGVSAGEIDTSLLKGRLGYIDADATPPQVGLLLEPEKAGAVFASFQVGETQVRVGEGSALEGSFYERAGSGEPTGNDAVISLLAPVDQMTRTLTRSYEPGTGAPGRYANVPARFESGPDDLLEAISSGLGPDQSSDWGPVSVRLSELDSLEGEAEIRA